MDISNSKSVAEREEEGITFDVRDAAGEIQKPGATITVVGSYSPTYRKITAANRNRMLQQRRSALDGEKMDETSLATLAGSIKSWTGFTVGDQPFPYTKENAIALLTQAPWIREQVEEAINDHAAFFPKPSVD